MWWKNILSNCVVLYLTTVSATSSDNVTLEESRQPRVSGHIVKLYSGPKPDPIYCDGEGFKSDASDCSVFYRCVRAGEGRYTVFRFQCGPGTIYDPDTEVCNHPRSTRRMECHGFDKPENAHSENDIEFVPPHELPIPIVTNKVNQPDTVTSMNDIYDTTKAPFQTQASNKIEASSYPSSSRPINSQNHKDNKKKYSICLTDGFVGDSDNCRTFYRCVNNGHGGFIRYEFSCSETTIWDDEAQSCNHPPLVRSQRCGRITDDEGESFTHTSNNFGSRLPETTLKPDQDLTGQIDTDKNYLPPQQPNKAQNQYVGTSQQPIIDSETQFEDHKQSGYNANDEEYDERVSTPSTPPSYSDQSTTQSNKNSNTKCTSSGFMGDPDDCRKFYRCVDNGQGGFKVYDFTCGEGTVWDQSIEGCNHEWAVKDCKSQTGQVQTEKTTVTTPASSSQTSTASTTAEDSNNEDNRPKPTNEPTTPQPSTASSNSDTVCKYNGFIGDENDCKKFYRCVDNGNGGYTKYEFTCGEGTVWDPEIDSCNHAWAVEKCGGESNNKETVTPSETSSPTTTTQSMDSDQTTKNEMDQSSTTEPSSTKPTSDQNCNQEGFYGDKKDCKKFYRCVHNGNGGYTKYEFTCGEGTVWDQEIQSCNHPSSTKSCESNTSISSSTAAAENNDATTVPPQPSEATESDYNEASTQKPETSPNCNSEGFYGDPQDCKKFYRCVDNGQGGYTKYEFSCGDGTVWDQNIQSCNHDTGNSKCSSSNQSEHSTTSSAINTSQETTQSQSGVTESQSTRPMQNEGHCDSEGFYANPDNCKKFYRCVSDGQGGYTKYDFDCGEGTVWVQEIQACDHDNDIKNCSNQNASGENQNVDKPTEQTTAVSQSQTMSDEQPSENEPSSTSNGQCTSEGFYANENDCHKFYRCVDNGNGGYTRYDFTCGEGTAWDSNIQSCDHESNVESCRYNNEQSNSGESNEPNSDEYQTTETTTATSSSSSTSSKPCNESSNSSQNSSTDSSNANEGTTPSTTTTTTASNQGNKQDECRDEGFYGNSQDCTKFYRCVDNGKGGYTKYDFTCGDGTIWDQDVTTCNHPQDVNNPSCTNNNTSSTMGTNSEQSSTESSHEPDSQSSSSTSTTEGQQSNQTDCSQESSSKKPESSKVNCTKEGFYEDPDDCKKFYRCVDWDGNGEKFSVFHFECGEGTIWDPQLDTCNYEDSVYPPRDCSGGQSQTEKNEDEKTTTQATTEKESTTQEVTTESTTTSHESTTTEKLNTTSEANTEGTTTTEKQSTTTEQTTVQDTTTTEKPSTTTEQTTTQGTTTTEKQSTTTDQTTAQDTTTTEKQTTTTEQTTTQDTTTTEKQSTTTQQDTSTTEKQSTTTETQQSTTTASSETTTQQSTEGTTQQTTESDQESSTTEQSHSSNKCPDTEDDQYMFVCPSGFRRHPKYCNMFYQCSEDNDTHEVKIATFTCPNNTIYDESKNQCVEEDEADQKCDGEMAQKRRVKRLEMNSKEPLVIGTEKLSCPAIGHYPFEKEEECSSAFLKCEPSKNGSSKAFIYRCPDNFIYWSVSRRCEPKGYLPNCKNTKSRWSGRWEIPVESKNVAH